MAREWCPKCQAIQNMNMFNTENMEKDEKEQDVKVTIERYQCSICNSFVRSEETKILVTNQGK